MSMIATRSIHDPHGFGDQGNRNKVFIDWIKNVVLSIRETRRCRSDYRRLLAQPDWVFEDMGLTRAQVIEAANDNRLTDVVSKSMNISQ